MSSIIQPCVHCQFYVIRKKRYCRMTVKEGQQFCGEHRPGCSKSPDGETISLRVPCPYDSKHTCYASHLAKHLGKCNAKPTTSLLPYIVPGINTCKDRTNTEPKMSLAEIGDSDLLLLIKKIQCVAKDCPLIPLTVLEHPAVVGELEKPNYGKTKKKHLLQNSSILGHLKKLELLKNKTCFIEFGAGRGQLSYWIGRAMEEDSESMLLLVDKASHRHKFDNRKIEGQKLTVQRIRADIADLHLNEVETLKKYDQIVAVSKHLCGAATDLAMQCLINSISNNVGESLNITGIMMAFCCHHRCSWNSFSGQVFLREKGFNEIDFSVMTGIASWATCGSGRSRSWKEIPSDEVNDHNQLEKDGYARLNLEQESRKEIGRQCKQIFDYGRLKYLQENGFTSSLVHYINEEISPENLCIIAVK